LADFIEARYLSYQLTGGNTGFTNAQIKPLKGDQLGQLNLSYTNIKSLNSAKVSALGDDFFGYGPNNSVQDIIHLNKNGLTGLTNAQIRNSNQETISNISTTVVRALTLQQIKTVLDSGFNFNQSQIDSMTSTQRKAANYFSFKPDTRAVGSGLLGPNITNNSNNPAIVSVEKFAPGSDNSIRFYGNGINTRNNDLNIGALDFSVGLKFRTQALNYLSIGADILRNISSDFKISLGSSHIEYQILGQNGLLSTDGQSLNDDQDWHSLSLERKGTNLRLSLDGAITALAITASAGLDLSNLEIGDGFHGFIDDLKIVKNPTTP
jgi:hypothetical protein